MAAAPAPAARTSVSWPLRREEAAAPVARSVPDVTGQSLRAAARTLHRSGFHVRIRGWGTVTGTVPGAGQRAETGATITVRAEQPRAL